MKRTVSLRSHPCHKPDLAAACAAPATPQPTVAPSPSRRTATVVPTADHHPGAHADSPPPPPGAPTKP